MRVHNSLLGLLFLLARHVLRVYHGRNQPSSPAVLMVEGVRGLSRSHATIYYGLRFE